MKVPRKILSFWPLILFLVLYFTLGYVFYKDFGVTNEEQSYYKKGRELISYFSGDDASENLEAENELNTENKDVMFLKTGTAGRERND